MEYLIAAQLFCGVFAAYVAAGKCRSKLAWFFIGLIPIVGVVAAVLAPHAAPCGHFGARSTGRTSAPERAKRCSGTFIPDCRGCAYFRKPLFDPSYAETREGYCEFFHKELRKEQQDPVTDVPAERDSS